MTDIDIRSDYAQARRAAYPDVGDQLDAVMKTLDAIINRKPMPEDASAVLQQVARVKAMYPKPVE